MFKTILLNENVSVGFKFVLESFSKRIAKFLGWYSCPILSCIVLWVVIAPTVVFFLAYLSPMVPDDKLTINILYVIIIYVYLQRSC